MPVSDPDGRVSLMLTESNLHLLALEGLISKEKVWEAIKGSLNQRMKTTSRITAARR